MRALYLRVLFVCLFSTVFTGLLTLPVTVHAQQAELQRMQARLPDMDALRLSGKAGENNRGLLEARASLSEEERALVDSENQDRLSLYRRIAQSQGSTPDEVGLQRAIRISQQARSGVWLQRPDGEWFRKE